MMQTTINKGVGRFINLLEVATENQQPISLTLSAGDFLQALDYSATLRLDAYKQEQEKQKQLAEMGDELTPKEAMEMLHISAATLWRYATKEGLLHRKNIGGKVFYSRAEIAKILEG